MRILKKFYHICKDVLKKTLLWYRLVWKSKSDFKISLNERIKFAFRGFTTNEYIWYDLAHHDYRDYISDYERIRSREMNGKYKIVLDDKLLFEEVFGKYIKVPTTYAWISDGNIFGMHEYFLNESNILSFLCSVKVAVLKWEKGYEGKGTFVIETKNNGDFCVNGVSKTSEELQRLFRCQGQAILCEYMYQSEFENSIYPYSTNTLRIVCAKKKGEKKAHIIKAVQRIGNDACKPVDNMSAGGFASEIDLATGKLGPAIAKLGVMERRMIPYEIHPDTGGQIAGRIIPQWDELKKSLTDLTNQFPYLNLVAWDVLLTEDGFCIIEGNASSGCGIFQMKHGVRNAELGDIYRSYGIIE
ncbi:MAG: sugar-transfer associated ATP-grasp domain-containing protein [Eubacteriales bacterium]|nr:sugar-transfer associated ATP-grasp domain-containing protein [Eubacteriales bacterium]